VNMVPWLFSVPSTFLGKWLSEKLITQGHSVTNSRKIIEVICLGSQALGLILIGEIFVVSCYHFSQISDKVLLSSKLILSWSFISCKMYFSLVLKDTHTYMCTGTSHMHIIEKHDMVDVC
jgi:hypothetical protein